MVTIYRSVSTLFGIIRTLILVRIAFSWLNIGVHTTIGRFVYDMTEPVLYPAKLLLSKLGLDKGMLDFSPMLAILMLELILEILRNLIF